MAMKIVIFYSILMICTMVLAVPSVVCTEEDGGKSVQKTVQTVEKKTEKGI